MGLDIKEVFLHNKKAVRLPQQIWPQMVIMALILLIFDIAVRRVVIPAEILATLKKKISPIGQPSKEIESQLTLKRLKKRISEFKVTTEPGGKIEPFIAVKPKKESKEKPEEESETTEYTSRLLQAKKRARRE